MGIRGDSAWNVPEPELVLVLYRGKVVGYSVGNDMTSRAILRNGAEVFNGETSTAQMARRYGDLVEWLTRHNTLPEVSALFTGTVIVPPPDFTLKPGDVVRIAIDGIGVLENDVIQV